MSTPTWLVSLATGTRAAAAPVRLRPAAPSNPARLPPPPLRRCWPATPTARQTRPGQRRVHRAPRSGFWMRLLRVLQGLRHLPPRCPAAPPQRRAPAEVLHRCPWVLASQRLLGRSPPPLRPTAQLLPPPPPSSPPGSRRQAALLLRQQQPARRLPLRGLHQCKASHLQTQLQGQRLALLPPQRRSRRGWVHPQPWRLAHPTACRPAPP